MMQKRPIEPPVVLPEKKIRLSLWDELTRDCHQGEQQKLRKHQEIVTHVDKLIRQANAMQPSDRLGAIELLFADELKDIQDRLEYFKSLPTMRVLAYFRSKAPASYLLPITDYQRRVNRVAKTMTSFDEATPEDKLFAREWFKADPEVIEMMSAWERQK